MKYIPLPQMDIVSNALNFSTPDCHVIGGCEIYTVKASKADKKLYHDIEEKLENESRSLVRQSASLSPPCQPAGKDGGHAELDLSRASPFGPLSTKRARRTFAYLIATLNASHTDYDFSALQPADFVRAKNRRGEVKDQIDRALQNLRPRQTALLRSASTGTLAKANDVWHTKMWKLVEKEMGKSRHLECWQFDPTQDLFDGEEGTIWSMHYFFYNMQRKRVCYFHLRGCSVISHSPTFAPLGYTDAHDDDDDEPEGMDLDTIRGDIAQGFGYEDDEGYDELD